MMQGYTWLLYDQIADNAMPRLQSVYFIPPRESTLICEELLLPGLLILYLNEGLSPLESGHDSETSAATSIRLIK